MFYVLLNVTLFPFSFANILMGKRCLVALLSLSSKSLVIVVWLILAVSWVCLQYVIVVFPDHIHLLFSMIFPISLHKPLNYIHIP